MFGITVRTALPDTIDPEPTSMPARLAPRRDGTGVLTVDRAVTIPAVYRALQVLATAASQLSLDVERNGQVLTSDQVPSLIRRPSLDMTRSDWVEAVILSLGAHGEAVLHAPVVNGFGVASLEVLPIPQVGISRDRAGLVRYTYKGADLNPAEVRHLCLMRLPGRLRGVGPIQAAREGLTSVADMRDYLSRWWRDSGQPAGILSSDQPLTAAEASRYRNAWNGLAEDGTPTDGTANPTGVKVVGKGLTYEPILLSPRDAMWIEAQNFTTLEIARLFGVPASLMLAAVEGSSRTYANIEQEWLAFVRFTLIGYLRKIEETLTEWTPRGQTVRFNLETLLRTDTKSRYEAHALALDPITGWMNRSEVRAIENLSVETVQEQQPA